MSSVLSRREFLKLASLVSLSGLVSGRLQAKQDKPNILVIVFDAWSASNLSLYGYPRQTMPHLEKLAERAVVYHHHYAGGPWTVPGTATLLTGTYPWTHRAFTVAENKTLPRFEKQNIFSQFKEAGYFTRGYSHNILADQFLYQYDKFIDHHTPLHQLFLAPNSPFTRLFAKDPDASAVAELKAFAGRGSHSSVFLDRILEALANRDSRKLEAQYAELFPDGLPQIPVPGMSFLLEEGINYLVETCAASVKPYLSYFHFYPPHQPYRTRKEFDGYFNDDGVAFPQKTDTIINEGASPGKMSRDRQAYDEFLLYVDAEFNRFYHEMERFGLLENTWLVLTSDHGEMFERSNSGHEIPTGVDPVIHIPLLIFPPGQKERVDIYSYTSAADVLPTLLQAAGLPAAEWAEGVVLPPFSAEEALAGRSIFAYHPENNPSRRPVSQGAATIIRDGVKLISTFGLQEMGARAPYLELYDLNSDPEELINLADARPELVEELHGLLNNTITAADRPFKK